VREAKDAAKRTRFYYPTDEALLSFFRSCADRHMADLTGAVGDLSALVLKGPNFVQVDAEAAAVFPNAIRIICFRDPRDIATSFLRIGERERPGGDPGKYRRRDVHFIGKKILESYGPFMRRRAAQARNSCITNMSSQAEGDARNACPRHRACAL
jgi:hypothetical protein